MAKLAIVVGHNSEKQGATRLDTGETEFVWNSRLAKMIEDQAAEYGITVRIFHRTPGLGYRREIAKVYDEVDRWKADASVELHFNSAASPAATGTEMLTSGTALSFRMAEAVQRETVAALGLRDRGVKTRTAQDRGGASLFSGRAPAILIEPFFGSSKHGQAATDEAHEREALADAILRGMAEAFEGFPRPDLAESRTLKATQRQRTAQTVATNSSVFGAVALAATQIREQIEGLPVVGPFADFMPYISAGLMVVVIVAQVYQRMQADRIDEARIDDHEKVIR